LTFGVRPFGGKVRQRSGSSTQKSFKVFGHAIRSYASGKEITSRETGLAQTNA
jgi:hypothetical protein